MPLTFLWQTSSGIHRAKDMKTGRTLIGMSNKINLLQHLSFVLADSLKWLMILGCPFIFKREATESLLEVQYRRVGLADSWRSLEGNQMTAGLFARVLQTLVSGSLLGDI